MTYSLWHGASGNIVNAYPSQEAALAVVRQALGTHGERYVEELALLRESAKGMRVTLIAEGHALVELARRSPRRPSREHAQPVPA